MDISLLQEKYEKAVRDKEWAEMIFKTLVGGMVGGLLGKLTGSIIGLICGFFVGYYQFRIHMDKLDEELR